MNRIAAPLIMLVVLLVLIAGGTFYQVDETEQVIVTQFGEPARAPITTPGLKVKIPFMQTIHRFDKRILEWDGLPGQIPTLAHRRPAALSAVRGRGAFGPESSGRSHQFRRTRCGQWPSVDSNRAYLCPRTATR